MIPWDYQDAIRKSRGFKGIPEDLPGIDLAAVSDVARN
jgi:hypothetical protein